MSRQRRARCRSSVIVAISRCPQAPAPCIEALLPPVRRGPPRSGPSPAPPPTLPQRLLLPARRVRGRRYAGRRGPPPLQSRRRRAEPLPRRTAALLARLGLAPPPRQRSPQATQRCTSRNPTPDSLRGCPGGVGVPTHSHPRRRQRVPNL